MRSFAMHAIVVFESVWGNTAAIARAIAEGMGPEVHAYPPDEVPPEELEQADLIVAGAPVFGFNLPTEAVRSAIGRDEHGSSPAPDLSHPSLRSWLEGLPAGHGRSAAFETRIWWSPRGATGTIERRLALAGYRTIAQAQKFVVKDKSGPLREGELDRAREWGRDLKRTCEADPSSRVAA
jgi:hypothetical protein